MIEAMLSLNETDRLAALKALKILDTPPEERFDRLTRLKDDSRCVILLRSLLK